MGWGNLGICKGVAGRIHTGPGWHGLSEPKQNKVGIHVGVWGSHGALEPEWGEEKAIHTGLGAGVDCHGLSEVRKTSTWEKVVMKRGRGYTQGN